MFGFNAENGENTVLPRRANCRYGAARKHPFPADVAAMTIAQGVITCAVLWGAVGLLCGLAFILFGIGRVDPAARGAYAFRPLLLPAFALIWPLALARWWALTRQSRPDQPGGSH